LRSKGSRCNIKNINGNEIDKEVIEAIKSLSANGDEYFDTLKKSLDSNKIKNDNLAKEQDKIKADIEKAEQDIDVLVETLANSSGTGAEKYILDKINALSEQVENNKARISAMDEEKDNTLGLTEPIDLMKNMLSSFSSAVDIMTIEQKRQTIRTFVKEVIWDGEYAHIVFFGSDYEYPFKSSEILADSDTLYPLGEHRK
jgi:site-specific DNA recombinase